MRRSNFIIGLGLSAVLHGALLYLLLGGSPPAPTPPVSPPTVTPIQIASVQEKLPLDPVPVAAPQAAPPPVEAAPAEALPLEQVVQPPPSSPKRLASLSEDADTAPPRPRPEPTRTVKAPTEAPAEAPAPEPAHRFAQETEAVVDSARTLDGTGDVTPPLRVHWRDARELIKVARTLGMRLAAVDRSGDIIGEIALVDPPGLRKWNGLPYGYSNRVRMLSPSIFSPTIGDVAGTEIHAIWVFVPSDRDRAMALAQKEAVRRAGARLEDVASVDGQFIRAANGSYRLDITRIRWRNGGGDRNG